MPKHKKHIAIYMRVSTGRQNMASQEADLKRWAETQGDKPIIWYRDTASGKSMDRSGWNRLHEQVLAGNVSALCCWRLDRLGRTASGLVKLFEQLTQHKVNLVSLKDGVDLSTAAGRLVANVVASVASYENEVRSERIKAGQAAARERGVKWGGRQKGTRWKVSDEHVRHIIRARKEGTPIAEVARVLGLSRPTVYRIIEEQT